MTQTLLGIGLYTLPEAARILRTRPQKLSRWADGYPFVSNKERRVAEPIIQRDLARTFPGHPFFKDAKEIGRAHV